MLADEFDQAQAVRGLLASQREQLAALAAAWLADGAASFGLWTDDRPRACWPAAALAPGPTDLVAPLRAGGRAVAELRVSGLDDAAARTRLAAEAELVSRLWQLESELDEITAALIDAQDQLLALYDLTASTRSHLAVPETLRTLARETARLLQVEGAFTVLVEPDDPPQVQHHPAPLLDPALLLGLFQQVQAGGSELVVSAAEAPAVLGQTSGVHNLLFEPIRIRGQVSAGLGLLNKPGSDFTSPDLKLVRTIAEQAGAQIENVLLYQETLERARLQHEMELAARIQLALLPRRLPQVAGLDLHAYSRPALHVGGDFYDLLALPNRPFIFAVGDVSGKGMSAALLMAMIRTAIHSQASFLPDPTPQAVMGLASRDLYDDLTGVNMFVTTWVGQYDPERRQLLYANAGHSPVVYCPAGGPARLLPADDPPLGVIPLDQPQGRALTLQPDDLLLVATDGFSEARNAAGELFGYDRLLRQVEDLARAGKPAGEVSAALLDAVAAFGAGCPQDDDQTLLVLRGVAP